MRKRGKRKGSEKEEAKTALDNDKGSSKATSRAKRVKALKPESPDEFFEDKRNLEDLWKAAFPVGTEV